MNIKEKKSLHEAYVFAQAVASLAYSDATEAAEFAEELWYASIDFSEEKESRPALRRPRH